MTDAEIKIYADHFAAGPQCILPFKGSDHLPGEKPETGVIFCPYVKPSRWRRIWNRITGIFRKKSEPVELTYEPCDDK